MSFNDVDVSKPRSNDDLFKEERNPKTHWKRQAIFSPLKFDILIIYDKFLSSSLHSCFFWLYHKFSIAKNKFYILDNSFNNLLLFYNHDLV